MSQTQRNPSRRSSRQCFHRKPLATRPALCKELQDSRAAINLTPAVLQATRKAGKSQNYHLEGTRGLWREGTALLTTPDNVCPGTKASARRALPSEKAARRGKGCRVSGEARACPITVVLGRRCRSTMSSTGKAARSSSTVTTCLKPSLEGGQEAKLPSAGETPLK